MPRQKLSPPKPILVVELFPELRRNLLALLDSLSSDEWNLQTAAPQWSVKDVALHLLECDVGILCRQQSHCGSDARV